MTLLAGLPSSGSQESYLGWGRGRSLQSTLVGDVIAYRPSTTHPWVHLQPLTQSNEPRSGNASKCLSRRVSGPA